MKAPLKKNQKKWFPFEAETIFSPSINVEPNYGGNMRSISSVIVVILCIFILIGCSSLPPSTSTEEEIGTLQVKVTPKNMELRTEFPLNAYSAVHSVYSGLIIPLRLVETMDLPSKYKLMCAMWSVSSQKRTPVRIEILRYFEEGRLCILPNFQCTQAQRLEWISNAIYSPIIKGPLRKQGKFISPDAEPMQNVKDTIFLYEDKAVRLSDLYSHERQQYLKKQGADLHLVQLYLHDGRSRNDHFILSLLEKQRTIAGKDIKNKFALGLMQVQYCLYTNDYEKADSILHQLKPKSSKVPSVLQQLYRFTYEEYCLTQAFNFQDITYLVEYNEFLKQN